MNLTGYLRAGRVAKCGALLGTASLLAMANMVAAQAQAQQAAAAPPDEPEQVLVTGSLIHGTAVVGVPVMQIGDEEFKEEGAITSSDAFKDVPSAFVPAFQSATDAGSTVERTSSINLRNLSSKGSRTLMLIDGMRFPSQGDSGCQIDPSIIPAIALQRIDILADGASATYGSDAVAGVVNVILKRGFEGAIIQGTFGTSPGYGHTLYDVQALYGTKWDTGDVTVSYEFFNQEHTAGTSRSYFTQDFNAAQGLDNRTPLINSRPGTISIGKATLASSATGQNPGVGLNTTVVLPGIPGSFSATTGTSCGNCYAIPTGQNGVGLTWAAIAANTPTAPNNTTLGTKNEINPFSDAWEQPNQERTAATVTFDQKILDGVQLYADAFYDNRRSVILNAAGSSPAPAQNNAFSVVVPTNNPYYPVGYPGSTSNPLTVYYDLSLETPVHIDGNELAGRYDFGFNVDLPFHWLGKVYYSDSDDKESAIETGLVNPYNASAALGYGVTGPATNGTVTFAKPANVPYLNLFCDPNQFTCNSATTLNYITGYRIYREENNIAEFGFNADGSVYALPGGDLKAAIGASYDKTAYFDQDNENYSSTVIQAPSNLVEIKSRSVWAVFGQINVPVFSDLNKIPMVDKLDIEASARYDHYDLYGGTFNPKVSATWGVIDGLDLKVAWGTSFRAPSFQEAGSVSGTLIQPINVLAGGTTNNVGTCVQSGAGAPPAVAGSAAATLDPNCTTALQSLGGIRLSNGAGIAAAVRPAGFTLQPETAQTFSSGFEWAPTDSIFKGLDIQATYYFIKIRNKLQGCAVGSTSGQLNDPNYASCFVTAANDPTFAQDVLTILANPRSQLPGTIAPSNISYVADGAIRNIGWQSTNGVDLTANYNWSLGDLGDWNTGVVANYIIDNYSVTGPGQPIISVYSTPSSGTRDSGGRLRYRAHLGWAGGPDDAWSITTFMNFIPHFNANGAALAPLCFLQGEPACDASGMPQYAQYTSQYPTLSNYIPGMYTFDLSIGYKTGDRPANPYLKNLAVQLTVNNIMDRMPAFQYSVATGSNTPHAFYNAVSADQRFVTIVLTKTF